MPLTVDDNVPTKFPTPQYLTLSNFKSGVITLIDKSHLPKTALERADNIFLVEDGQPSIRPGVDWFGTTPLTTATTPFSAPTAAAGTNWTNPTNVETSDNTRAVYATTTQDNLKITGFNLAIPTGATILGVSVHVEGNGTDATAANRSVELGLTRDGTTLVGTRAAAQNLTQTTDSTLTFGGASSLFGTTWTPAQLNASTFGVLLRAANTNAGARNIDQVTVSITYTYEFPIDGFDYFDNGGEIHLVVTAGGYTHRSLDDGQTWDQCTGTTLTPGVTTNMNQYNAFLYETTGEDIIVRYDGTTVLQSYTVLTTPSAPTVAATGLSGSQYTVYYKVSAVSEVGFSAASVKVSQAVSLPRDAWDSTTNFLTLTLPAPQTTQTRMDIFFSTDDLNYYYLDSVVSSTGTPGVTYKDDGTAVIVPSTTAPIDNTTQGPKVAELTNVGSRMYGVRDPLNRYRIWFTSGTPPYGAFSNGYDGGYLDWQLGGKYLPTKVEDYRDGKGTPLATIWCDSADGQGCILQMSLDQVSVGDLTVTVPSAYKLPGSRGTPSPGSVVNVLNDYFFYNSQAFYNLGSRAQFLNLLSTDEASANIRPSVKQISTLGQAGIASAYSDAKVYFSVPTLDNTVNDTTIVYDTERKAWLPTAFTIGFAKFLRYTDQLGNRRLLCLKAGDTRLSEISTSIQGDYGQAFETNLLTGLYPPTKNRFEFEFTEEAEFEFSQAQGRVIVEVLGEDRKKFQSQKVKIADFESQVNLTGWDTFAWDTTNWDDTTSTITDSSGSSQKKYFSMQKELNSVQWNLRTNTLNAKYILRTLQTWGTDTEGGHPAQWRQP